jgi:hypothetical protein
MRKAFAIFVFTVGVVGLLFVITVLAFVLLALPDGANSPAPQKAASTPPKAVQTFTKENTPGCYKKEDWERLGRLVAEGDREAFSKLMGSYLAGGQCRMIRADTHVYVESAGIFSDPCVRPQGETECLFVPIGVLEQRQ